MATTHIEDTIFNTQDFSFGSGSTLPALRYTECTFTHCDFTGANLSGIEFIDCSFAHCALTQCTLRNTGFKTVRFEYCKMTGINFAECSSFLFAIEPHHCALDYANFTKLRLPKTVFHACSLKDAEFNQTDLSDAVFRECNMTNAFFDYCNLTRADFRTSFGIVLDPERNTMTHAQFTLEGALGLLVKYNISIQE